MLPDKPSELIKLALKDLELCELDPNYQIEMRTYYSRDEQRPCLVCFAGAVIAQTLNVTKFGYLAPWQMDLDARDVNKLYALNSIRLGMIHDCQAQLGLRRSKLPEYVKVSPYEDDKIQFKADMLKIAQLLEGHNL